MALDYSGQNLRGRSFRGQNLTKADFSHADIRGVDFSGANLRRAKFVGVQAGLQLKYYIIFFILLLLVAVLSGFTAGISITFVVYYFLSKKPSRFTIFLVSFSLIFIIRTVLDVACGPMAVKVQLIAAVVLVLAVVAVGAPAAAVDEPKAKIGAIVVAGIMSMLFVLAVALNLSVPFIAKVLPSWSNGNGLFEMLGDGAWLGGLVGGFVGAILGSYVGRVAIDGDQRFCWIWKITIAFAATRGTSFRSANLTNADFTKATLKSTDFREAILTRTCWREAKKLECVRPGTTYLKNAQLRQWLIGNGLNKNFEGQNLRGVNLQKANLAGVSFIRADLSEANLQGTDLSGAKLVQTQLDKTDLTGATLTGAIIEDWGITSHTKLSRVRCEYVFMRSPYPDDPNPRRKPDNWNETFKDGDFADFIKPIVDTLDLYHNRDLDPRAIAISFKQLAENHPEAELRIVGMEVKGADKFLLRAKTAASADKSELSAEYFEIYNQLKALAEQELKALIAEKDSRILSLENMVATALQRPNFYSNVEQVGFLSNNPSGISQSVSGSTMHGGMQATQDNNNTQTHNQGDITMSGDRNINMGSGNYNERIEGDYIQGNSYAKGKQSNFNLQGAQFAGGLVDAETVNVHQIGGNITNYTPEQRQNLAKAAAEIQQLLQQLEQTYPTNTPLEKHVVVTEALRQIESNPTLKTRIIEVLRADGTEALKKLLNHPLVNILLAALEGW